MGDNINIPTFLYVTKTPAECFDLLNLLINQGHAFDWS